VLEEDDDHLDEGESIGNSVDSSKKYNEWITQTTQVRRRLRRGLVAEAVIIIASPSVALIIIAAVIIVINTPHQDHYNIVPIIYDHVYDRVIFRHHLIEVHVRHLLR
jgi:hypothetical protein